MRRTGLILSATAALSVLAGFAAAQDAEAPEGAPAGAACDMSDEWRVVGVENKDAPGMVIHVNKRDAATKKPDCEETNEPAEFTIGTPQDTLWLTGITGEHLILSRSTGPKSNLVVHRLSDKTVVIDVPAYEPDFDSWGITYWEQKEAATAENCIDFDYFAADGLSGVIAHESRYDFATKQTLVSGKTRCEATQ